MNEKFGVDINSMTRTVLVDEISGNLNKDLYERYRTLGERSKDLLYTKWQRTLLKYFKNLSKIKSIFPGIEELHREATQDEVDLFLDNS